MRKLGNLELPEGIVWENQGNWSGVRRNVKNTTDGGLVMALQPLIEGQPINLVLNADRCWATYAQKQTLCDMAKELSSFTFIWDSIIKQVMFVNDPVLTPLLGYENIEHDLFIGNINLITV